MTGKFWGKPGGALGAFAAALDELVAPAAVDVFHVRYPDKSPICVGLKKLLFTAGNVYLKMNQIVIIMRSSAPETLCYQGCHPDSHLQQYATFRWAVSGPPLAVSTIPTESAAETAGRTNSVVYWSRLPAVFLRGVLLQIPGLKWVRRQPPD
ncbi:hypothetical protein [Enterobacter mori]|uniref:hypothetical protein n=1 Tax=Enterobacter mori TaxID=539813 RepID=UPI003B8446A0